MAEREWKSGDVATITTVHGWAGTAIYTDRDLWHNFDGYWSFKEIAQARPLVVIDPEDREQVETVRDRLFDAIEDQNPGRYDPPRGVFGNALQAALREFANPTPPKPAEPTGLGAVVEDAEGRIYTRYEKAGPKHEPQPWWQSANGPEHDVVRRFSWSDINAVRVLSEGVTQ